MPRKTLEKIKRVVNYARPHWKLYAVVLGISLLSLAVGLITPYIYKLFFDDVLVNKRFELFGILVGAFLALYLLGSAIAIAGSFFRLKLSQEINNDVKLAVFSHLQKLDPGFYMEKKTGDILSRFTDDITSLQSLISTIVDGVFMNVAVIAATLAVALALDWQVTVLSLLVIPLYVVADRYFLARQLGLRKTLIESSAELMDYLNESLGYHLAIKAYGKERQRTWGYMKRTKDRNELVRSEYLLSSKHSFVTGFIMYLPVLVLLGYGGYQVLTGAMSIGTLVALQAYIPQLYSPLLSLVGLNRTIKFQLLSVDRIFSILDTKPDVEEPPGARELKRVDGPLRADAVSMALDHRVVLRSIDFVARSGKITAIAGSSGVGKTTFSYLLARLYDPDEGAVYVNGINLRSVKLSSLRKHIGIVPQQSFIFSGTVEENIKFANLRASKEAIREAAKAANADAFIENLPQGYATYLGVRGSKISEGQRQRIALARAFLLKPEILIIDEGFVSIDAATQQSIMGYLKELARQGRIIIIITHRTSILQGVDEIAFMKEGRVVERGSYRTLVRKRGEFYSLYHRPC